MSDYQAVFLLFLCAAVVLGALVVIRRVAIKLKIWI